MKLFEDRQLGTALETPGRSNIEKDDARLCRLSRQGVPVVEATLRRAGRLERKERLTFGR